jgi:transposase
VAFQALRDVELDARAGSGASAELAGAMAADESAGKRQGGKTRKGSPWLRALLVQAAHAAARKKGTYLAAQYRRLAARRGTSRAAIAVGHSILVIAYHLLRRGTVYRDLGPNYFDERDRAAVERRLVRRLESLGYTVSLQPTQVA